MPGARAGPSRPRGAAALRGRPLRRALRRRDRRHADPRVSVPGAPVRGRLLDLRFDHRRGPGLARWHRSQGERVSLVRVVPTELQPTGMALTHDGALLVVANGDHVLFLDTARM